MGIYNRTNNLPEEVSSLQNSINEIKQAQIIGNDNLKVYWYSDDLASSIITAGSTAIIKMTFTFDSPSTSYVMPHFYFNFENSTTYNDFFYADPLTVNSNTSKSWFYTITPNTNLGFFLGFKATCSDKGVATVVRIA